MAWDQLKKVAEQWMEGNSSEASPYCVSWRGKGEVGQPDGIVWWKTVEQLQSIVRICSDQHIAIYPMGGNTSLSDGARPATHKEYKGPKIVLKSLHRSIHYHEANHTVEAGAAVVWEQLQQAILPYGREVRGGDTGAKASSEVASMFVTNTGGNTVYGDGTLVDNVVGVRAVTMAGEVLDHRLGLRKDNFGLHLPRFLGALNFPLCLVTEVVFQTYPRRSQKELAMIGINQLSVLPALIEKLQQGIGEFLLSAELMGWQSIGYVLKYIPHTALPFSGTFPYVLQLECGSASSLFSLQQLMLEALKSVVAEKLVEENQVFLAMSGKQQEDMRAIRHHITIAAGQEAKARGYYVKGIDASCPAASLEVLLDFIASQLPASIEFFPFGHYLDNGLHCNLLIPKDFPKEQEEALMGYIFDKIIQLGGSLTAEHGPGRVLVPYLKAFRPHHYAMMVTLKKAFDPKGLLAPGVGVE